MKKQKQSTHSTPSTKGASKDLLKFVKECFKGNNEVKFFISERGNQRIEIQDIDTKEIWQTLEAVHPIEDMNNYDDIAAHIMMAMLEMSKK